MKPGQHKMSRRPILLVEDDRDIREILAEELEAEGFEVITAPNGFEALRVIRDLSTRPSIILLDLMMPVLDGYGFLAERRKDSALASIPVAIVTASQGIDRRRVDTDTAIIPKPIDMGLLLTLLEQLGARSEAPE